MQGLNPAQLATDASGPVGICMRPEALRFESEHHGQDPQTALHKFQDTYFSQAK